jgi:hypothetical protein
MGMLLAKLPYNRGASCDVAGIVRALSNGDDPHLATSSQAR